MPVHPATAPPAALVTRLSTSISWLMWMLPSVVALQPPIPALRHRRMASVPVPTQSATAPAAPSVWDANLGTTQCEKCHGSAATAAAGTFKNLSGNTTAMRSVIHVSHLASTLNMSSDVVCSACHVVPATPVAANHMDTGKPADVIAGAGYTATVKTCNNTCHGSALPASNPARALATWNAKLFNGAASVLGDGVNGGTNPGSGDCSKCHGYPPQNGHAVSSCNTCHSHMNADNRTFSNAALHIDGTIDAVSGCDGCHDYDTVGSTFAAGVWSGGTWGKNPQDGLTPNEGFGAHAKHINYIKTRLAYTLALNPASQTFGATGTDPARISVPATRIQMMSQLIRPQAALRAASPSVPVVFSTPWAAPAVPVCCSAPRSRHKTRYIAA